MKLGDPNEGSLKNNNLYNDKELFDDADLDWYDYGFRNYDPQIGRFTQLDPLTDQFPELTNYQYASNDPIGNVDVDGLEGGSAVLGHVGDAVVTSSSFMPDIAVQGLSKAAVAQKSITAINAGINAIKLGANLVDHTQVKTLVNLKSVSREIQTQSYLAQVFDKMGSWLNRVSHGSGSYQDYGIIFTGNDNGTMEFRDHVGTLLDAIDLGPAFFGAINSAGLDPEVFRELVSSSGGLKYVANFVEASKSSVEVAERIREAVKKIRQSLPGNESVFKQGNVVYDRMLNLNLRVMKNGKLMPVASKANDTFPPKRVPPDYINPINNH